MLGTLVSLVRAKILDSTSRALVPLALFLGKYHLESLKLSESLNHTDSPWALHPGLIPQKLFKICFLMLQWNLLARVRPSHRTFPLGSVPPLPFIPLCIHAYKQPVCEHILYAWPLAVHWGYELWSLQNHYVFRSQRKGLGHLSSRTARPTGPCTLPFLLIHQIFASLCVSLFTDEHTKTILCY